MEWHTKLIGPFALLGVLAALAISTANAQMTLALASGPSPFAGCSIQLLPDETNYLNAEVEPWVAVNPRDTNNRIGVWQQDRFTFGGARGLLTGASHDGGNSWSRTFAHFSHCAGGNPANGGDYDRASDPFVTIAPNGHAYQIALAFDVTGPSQAILVSRSTNGGDSWSEPITLIRDTDPTVGDDKEAITADPKNANLVYAVWDRLECTDASQSICVRGPTWFARTTNGGASWQPAHVIYDPGADAQTIANQIVVLPNGDLVDLFVRFLELNEGSPNAGDIVVAIVRSNDKGVTWSAPIVINTLQSIGVVDRKTGEPVRTGDIIPDIAVSPESGVLYVVWQDARFSGSKRDGIVLSTSTNGGLSWSAPVQINKVPKVQAFTGSVDVGEDGSVAVTYYDFRKDTSDPATLLTDYWQIVSQEGGQTWRETPLAGSFDMRIAPSAGGFFLGDYEGLSHGNGAFLPFFVMTNSRNVTNRTDVFAALSGENGDGGAGNREEVNAHPKSWPERVKAHRERGSRSRGQ